MKPFELTVLFYLILICFAGSADAATITENIDIDDGWKAVISNDYVNDTYTHPDSIFVASTSLVEANVVNAAWDGKNVLDTSTGKIGNLYFGQLYPATHTRYRVQMNITRTDSNPYLYMFQGDLFRVGVYKFSTGYRVYVYHYNETGGFSNPYTELTNPDYADITWEYYPNETIRVWETSNTSNYLQTRYHDDKHTPYLAFTGNILEGVPGALGNGTTYTILKFEQYIPKKLVTYEPSNSKFALGFDGPRQNYTAGRDWLTSRGYKATMWYDTGLYAKTNDSQRAAFDDLTYNKGWETGIHFTKSLALLSAENATNMMDSETAQIEAMYGPVLSWVSLGNNENESHTNYMYETFGSIRRNSQVANSGAIVGATYIMSKSTVSSDDNTKFWDEASQHKSFKPIYVHSVISPLQESASTDYNDFDRIMTNYTNDGIEIIPFGQWWYETTNMNQTISSVYFDENDSYFTINTRGYTSNFTIYDPHSEGVWYNSESNISTVIDDDASETEIIVNTMSQKTITKLNDVIITTSGSVTISPIIWEDKHKKWIETSETQQSVTHTIGGFPANTDIQIKRDDINYETVTSNETGYIEWVYDGGFSEHTFSIERHDFNASLTSGAYPLTTQFTTSSDGIDAYYWDFENDGIIDSTKQNPVHTYGKAGTYTVNLTVQDEYGNFSTVKTDYITVSAPAFASDPVAWFNWVFSYLSSMYVSIWVTA